jgi:hypothetical protein
MGEHDIKPESTHGAPYSDVAAEVDKPQSARIMVMIGALSAVVGISVLGLWQLFMITAEAEVYEKELAPDNPELQELRTRDEGLLNNYAALESGGYQIPIQRAMSILVMRPELMARQADAGSVDAGPEAAGEGGQ